MMRLALVTVMAVGLFPLSAMASNACDIGPVQGLLGRKGATVTMEVDNNGKPCGEDLWVRRGVIPFTWLELGSAPRHGDLSLAQPSGFFYAPKDGFGGTDHFEIIAHGNNAAGVPVTGRMRVNVRVATLPRGEGWEAQG